MEYFHFSAILKPAAERGSPLFVQTPDTGFKTNVKAGASNSYLERAMEGNVVGLAGWWDDPSGDAGPRPEVTGHASRQK